jgi:hypothetical protein
MILELVAPVRFLYLSNLFTTCKGVGQLSAERWNHRDGVEASYKGEVHANIPVLQRGHSHLHILLSACSRVSSILHRADFHVARLGLSTLPSSSLKTYLELRN